MKYFVEVLESDFRPGKDGGEVVKRIDCGESKRKAERVEDGVNINLNHDKYHTRIISQPSAV